MKRLFLRHYLTLSAFLLGLALTFFVGGFVALGLNNNQWATFNFYRAGVFGFATITISFIGGSIRSVK